MRSFDPADPMHTMNDSQSTSEDLREMASRDAFRGTDFGHIALEAAEALDCHRSELSSLSEAALWAFEFCYHRDHMNAKVHCAPVRYSPITERLAMALIEVVHGCEEAEEVVASARQAF